MTELRSKLVLILASSVILLSVLVLYGWILDIQFLKSISTGWASMKPNTAIALALTAFGISLLEILGETSWIFLLRFLSILITFIGGLTLAEYLFSIDLGIDTVFFREKVLAPGPSDPARVGPNTAFVVMLLGLSLSMIAFQRVKLKRWVEAFTVTAFLVSFLGLVGYLYEVSTLYGVSNFTKMALHTSVALIFLCVALVLSQKDFEITKVMMSEGAGGVTLRRWLPWATIMPLLIARVCLSFVQRGYLNLEMWVALGITPISALVAFSFLKYAKLADKLDEDRFKVELELKQKQLEARYTLSHAINSYLAQSQDSEPFSKILEIVCRHLGWKVGTFWTVDNKTNRLTFETYWSDPSSSISRFVNETKVRTFNRGIGLPGRVWLSKEPHWISDVSQDENFPRAQQALASGLRAAFGFPIYIGDEVIGVIEVFKETIENPDQHLLAICQTIGAHLGMFIQKRQMEKTTREERDFVKTLLRCSINGIFSYDRELRFTTWNSAMERMTGFAAEKVLGKRAPDVFPHIRNTPKEEQYHAVLRGEQIHMEELEFKYITTQEKGFCETKWVPLVDEKKQIIGGLVVTSDITKRKRAEIERERLFNHIKEQQAMMIVSSRMAALGEMAGGIAHEINTPLGIIGLCADRIQGYLKSDSLDIKDIAEATTHIEETTFRIAKIVKGLLMFARDGTGDDLEVVSVRSLIDDVRALCSERFKNRGIDLVIPEIPENLWVSCRGVQVSQVILNLLNNACDAVEKSNEKWIKVVATGLENTVELSVIDSGKGIPKNVQEKLMQPFFTTKEIGKGTGLGLSVSKGIMESHGGSLEFDSNFSHTRFVARLPRWKGKVGTHEGTKTLEHLSRNDSPSS